GRGQRLLGPAQLVLQPGAGEREEPAALVARPRPKPGGLPLPRVVRERGADRAPEVLDLAGEELALDRHRRELARVHRARVVQRAEERERDVGDACLAGLGDHGRWRRWRWRRRRRPLPLPLPLLRLGLGLGLRVRRLLLLLLLGLAGLVALLAIPVAPPP